jgi:hypothetical protein
MARAIAGHLRAQYAVAEWNHGDRKGPLNLAFMGLTALPPLPPDLTDLRCQGNMLTALPALPSGLRVLVAAENRLTELPPLPANLLYLDVTDNRLAMLPLPLPAGLEQLHCSRNHLTDEALPQLTDWPPRLHTLYCSRNRLRYCPELPGHITRRLIGACWTYRPHLLRTPGALCPCCGQPLGAYGPPI